MELKASGLVDPRSDLGHKPGAEGSHLGALDVSGEDSSREGSSKCWTIQ